MRPPATVESLRLTLCIFPDRGFRWHDLYMERTPPLLRGRPEHDQTFESVLAAAPVWDAEFSELASVPIDRFELTEDDLICGNAVARARRLERFLTQPFFTTEQFSGMKGKLVSLKDSLDGCERILRDEFKDYPESTLYMIGAIG